MEATLRTPSVCRLPTAWPGLTGNLGLETSRSLRSPPGREPCARRLRTVGKAAEIPGWVPLPVCSPQWSPGEGWAQGRVPTFLPLWGEVGVSFGDQPGAGAWHSQNHLQFLC